MLIASKELAFKNSKCKLICLHIKSKIVFLTTSLLLVLSSVNVAYNLLFIMFLLTFSVFTGTPIKTTIKKMIVPTIAAFFIIFFFAFMYGSTIISSLTFLDFRINLYQEGMLKGALIGTRIIASVFLLLLFILNTPLDEIISSLKWLRVPDSLIEMIIYAYRFIFLLVEEGNRVYLAQKSRLGFSNGYISTLKSLASLGGILLIRAYDRGNTLYKALKSRCYIDKLPEVTTAAFNKKDRQQLFIGLSFIVALFALQLVVRNFTLI